MEKWICLAAGSLAGGFARYGLAGAVSARFGAEFPRGTLLVNLCGCFLIGALNSLAEEKFLLGPNARILLMTGFCGAFTTFSTFMLETANLMKGGELARAGWNVALSLAGGFLLFWAGATAAKTI